MNEGKFLTKEDYHKEERKKKTVRYEVLIFFAILSVAAGFAIYFIQYNAHRLTEDGLAFNASITPEQTFEQNFQLFLETSDNHRIDIYRSYKIDRRTIRQLIFFSGTADLKWSMDGETFTLIQDISALRREEVQANMRVFEKDGRLAIETRYAFHPLIDFRKYEMDTENVRND